MKRLSIQHEFPVFGMAKLSEKRADKNLVGEFDRFIYFSGNNGQHGPRLKFYGGKADTDTTKQAPSYSFSKTGPGKVIIQPWMNKKNCPNAFNDQHLNLIRNFINKFLPILLLVWYFRLDENDALDFFEGRISFLQLLDQTNLDSDKFIIHNLEELHQYCLSKNLYS